MTDNYTKWLEANYIRDDEGRALPPNKEGWWFGWDVDDGVRTAVAYRVRIANGVPEAAHHTSGWIPFDGWSPTTDRCAPLPDLLGMEERIAELQATCSNLSDLHRTAEARIAELEAERDTAKKFHDVAVAERDFERVRCDNLEAKLGEVERERDALIKFVTMVRDGSEDGSRWRMHAEKLLTEQAEGSK